MTPQQKIMANVPSYGKHHYFFYGLCSENQISAMIATAEKYGCEYLSMVPMEVTVQASRLALANGQNHTQKITAYRLFVRCPREEFEAIYAKMEKDAAVEEKQGFRP